MKNFNFKAADMSQNHVYILFIDGELGMTKAGDLLGSRNLHQMEGSILPESLIIDLPISVLDQFTESYNGFKCVFMNSSDDATEYRDWLLSDGLSPATVCMMKERLVRANWLSTDKDPDRTTLCTIYSSFISNQTSIHGYLWEQHRDATSNGELPRIEYLLDCIEGEFDDNSWAMLDKGRAMRDAWHSFDCDSTSRRQYAIQAQEALEAKQNKKDK